MLLGNMVGFDIFLNPLGGLLRRRRRQGVRMKFKLYRAEGCLAGCIDNGLPHRFGLATSRKPLLIFKIDR